MLFYHITSTASWPSTPVLHLRLPNSEITVMCHHILVKVTFFFKRNYYPVKDSKKWHPFVTENAVFRTTAWPSSEQFYLNYANRKNPRLSYRKCKLLQYKSEADPHNSAKSGNPPQVKPAQHRAQEYKDAQNSESNLLLSFFWQAPIPHYLQFPTKRRMLLCLGELEKG